jgi:two-component sensor histidine kinase
MRGPEELEREIADRRRAEAELLVMQASLERRVTQRTTELANEVEQRKEAESRLLQAHGELEEKVRQRTSELTQANQQLIEAERRMQTSLAEKEVLLKEIHHRVKNNLQVISSLLDLQSEHTDDEPAAAMFRECQSRVRSMALVHERLYRSTDLAKIEFAGYLESLTEYLFHSYSTDSQAIRLELDVSSDIRLPIDLAIPCGLLVNELVSNCLKHAFQGQTAGLLQIQLLQLPEDKMFLKVVDSGKGLPDALDLENAPTFGLQLVAMLIKQLGGKLALSRTGGTAFNVTFPLNKSGSPGEIDK